MYACATYVVCNNPKRLALCPEGEVFNVILLAAIAVFLILDSQPFDKSIMPSEEGRRESKKIPEKRDLLCNRTSLVPFGFSTSVTRPIVRSCWILYS